ncbi:MAG: hypothetical protein KC593_03810 [Myxococcales bacterium]|nr:hypothetical protein [Myxococcales bacterium]MCB9629901.1 hypothetical protein [Sandaracinaceae bacterium]
MPVALLGALALVGAVYSLGDWLYAAWSYAPYRARGVPCEARVDGKFEETTSTRTGRSSRYTLLVSYDAPAGGAAPRVSAEVSDFVYYPSYTRLAVGDSVTVLVLPEAPTGPVLLREVTVDRAMVPLTQSPWAVVVLGLLSAGCVLVYRRFG